MSFVKRFQKFTFQHLGYFIYIVALLLILLSFKYLSNQELMKINGLYNEVSRLRGEYLQKRTTYQNSVSMTAISYRLQSRGVSPSKEPVKDIIIIK